MKKGFTLIELLSVLVLLGMISLITIPIVDKILKENRETLYQTNVEMLEAGAKSWASENVFSLPDEEGEFIDLTVCDLEKAGFIEIDVRNPKTDELFYKDSYVRITKDAYGFNYEYNETSGTESAVCE